MSLKGGAVLMFMNFLDIKKFSVNQAFKNTLSNVTNYNL
jgi:hypothetical protein